MRKWTTADNPHISTTQCHFLSGATWTTVNMAVNPLEHCTVLLSRDCSQDNSSLTLRLLKF
uniref:Uncharacterized protein n=1 Tax=Anguilla anguilla TaxID=7936 RepID=A0A0E9QBS2_ANGAN